MTRELRAADEVTRLLVKIDVDADVVGATAQLFQRVHHIDAVFQCVPRRDVRIVGDDAQAESLGLAGHGATDVAQADDAEHLAGDVAHRRQILTGPHAVSDQLVMQHELPGADQEVHDGVVRHLLGAERRCVRQDHAVRRRRVQIEMVVAMAEGDQALAAAVQAHVREGGRVEPVALDHRGVYITQRLGQLRDAMALVADHCSPGEPDSAALLFERRAVEGLGFRGADVKDFDGLQHGQLLLEFASGG